MGFVFIVLLSYDYEGSRVIKVFDSYDKAKEYVHTLDDVRNANYTIQKWEITK